MRDLINLCETLSNPPVWRVTSNPMFNQANSRKVCDQMRSDRFTEARLVTYDPLSSLRVWKNPGNMEIEMQAEQQDLRGLCDGQDIYVWPAKLATHRMIPAKIGLDYDGDLMPFYVESPEYLHTSQSERTEWADRGPAFTIGETNIYIDTEYYNEDEYMACRAFRRMLGNPVQAATA